MSGVPQSTLGKVRKRLLALGFVEALPGKLTRFKTVEYGYRITDLGKKAFPF